MAKAIDPVCGMTVDTDKAAAKARHEGETYYFCSTGCERQFVQSPAKFADRARESGDEAGGESLEKHEPPRTTLGGITAPKFGSAGSGGLEYERLPEAHDDKKH
ncbi:MAG: YHS domain-containing protein [Gemmatimonadaceae bacterium]